MIPTTTPPRRHRSPRPARPAPPRRRARRRPPNPFPVRSTRCSTRRSRSSRPNAGARSAPVRSPKRRTTVSSPTVPAPASPAARAGPAAPAPAPPVPGALASVLRGATALVEAGRGRPFVTRPVVEALDDEQFVQRYLTLLDEAVAEDPEGYAAYNV